MDITRLPQELLLIVALVGACLLGVWYWEGSIRSDERAKVTAELDKAWRLRLQVSEDSAKAQLEAQGRKHAKALSDVQRHASQLALELLKRPSRAEQSQQPHPLTAAACPVCTGERLAREDAEFLGREAAAAAEQQLDLQRATGAYNTCRKTLEDVTKGTQHDDLEKPPGVQP